MRYYLLAFFSGAVVLVLEILGARILAPYLGTAFFVWVNIIGVILAALSAGYWLGGALADKNQRALPYIFLGGALTSALIVLERPLLPFFGVFGVRLGSFGASLLLFAPPSIILGMVSPYLVKLASRDMAHLGRTSGKIFAASTVGSIAGTFATGFWLIPNFTVTQLLWGVVVALTVLAFASFERAQSTRVPPSAIALCVALPLGLLATGSIFSATTSAHIIYEKNSAYYNIRIHDRKEVDGRVRRTMLLDGSTQGARYVSGVGAAPSPCNGCDEPPFKLVDISAKIIRALRPAPRAMLMIGGGSYSIPELVKAASPESVVTVVEIDPEVTEAARRFFLNDSAMEFESIHADGRVFLNETKKTFDLVYADAYSSAYAVPGHLASREAFLRMRDALSPDGIILLNIASAVEGKNALLFRSLWKTFDGVFPWKAAFSTVPEHPDWPQNTIVVATKNGTAIAEETLRFLEMYRYRGTPDMQDVPLLRDDFAPTDHLVESLVEAIYPALRQYHQ